MSLWAGHFCPILGRVRGNEFVRCIQVLGRGRGVEVRWDEVDKRAYHKMLKQLCLSEKDFE